MVLSAVEKSGRLDTGAQPEEFFFNLLRTLLYLIALGSKEVANEKTIVTSTVFHIL